MNEQDRTREQLTDEYEDLRRQVATLRDIQQRYCLLLETAPLGVYECNIEGVILNVNPSGERITGYGMTELIGTHIWDHLKLGPQKESLIAHLRRLVTEQPRPSPHFITVTTKSGQAVDVQMDWSFRRNAENEIIGFLAVISDITARIEAESASQDREARYSLLTETVPQLIWRSTGNGVIECNRHWHDYTGQTPEEAQGHGWMAAVHPDDLAQVTEAMFRAAVEGTYQAEYRLRRASDGSYRWHLARALPMRDKQGNIPYWVGSATDIDEQKRAEEALRKAHDELEQRIAERTAELAKANTQLQREAEERRQAEATLNAFFNASTAILNICDDEFRYIKTDSLTPTYFGLDSQSIVGKSVEALAPAFVKEFGPMIRQVIATGEPVHNVEVRSSVPSRPDDIAYWRASYFAVPLPEGKRGYGVVGVEVTDMKRAEEALRQSEEKYRTLVETSPDGVIMTDLEGRVLFASERVREMHGADRVADLMGRNPLDFLVPEDHQRCLKNVARTLQEGMTRNIEYTLVKRNGTHLAGEVSAAVLKDSTGQPRALVAILRDITERKRAEEALQQSNQQLRTIYDGMVEGLLITNTETKRFMRVNSSLCRMLGYSEEELLAASIKDIHPPEEVPNDLQRFQAAAEGRVSINEDRPVLRKDGGIFYADITGHPILYEGQPCLLALFRDVTERKRAQEALRKEHRNLKHLLQSSDHERQLIAYEIHDGLAQQLAASIMQFDSFEHLKDTKPRQAADAFHAGLTMLRQGHFEARRLIAGVRPPILDDEGVVAAIGHLVNEQIRRKGPKVEFFSKVDFDRLVPVLENAIYRIAQEALANAYQHSKTEKVRVSLSQQGDRVRIEIRDWGIGFNTKSVQESQFGLEGIRQRARLLGGKCRIQTAAGKGTRIIVELPLLARESE